MKCFNCKVEIPHTFTFALAENRCPSCGKEILDEETRALKTDIVNFVGESITLRPETLDKLAMLLISRYNIQGINGPMYVEKATKPVPVEEGIEVEEEMSEKEQAILDTDEEIRKLQAQRDREMQTKELDDLKGEALKEAMRDRYNISFDGEEDGAELELSPTDFGDEDLPPAIRQQLSGGQVNPAQFQQEASADFGDINPILEAERLKQKVQGAKAMQGGKDSAFRRSVI